MPRVGRISISTVRGLRASVGDCTRSTRFDPSICEAYPRLRRLRGAADVKSRAWADRSYVRCATARYTQSITVTWADRLAIELARNTAGLCDVLTNLLARLMLDRTNCSMSLVPGERKLRSQHRSVNGFQSLGRDVGLNHGRVLGRDLAGALGSCKPVFLARRALFTKAGEDGCVDGRAGMSADRQRHRPRRSARASARRADGQCPSSLVRTPRPMGSPLVTSEPVRTMTRHPPSSMTASTSSTRWSAALSTRACATWSSCVASFEHDGSEPSEVSWGPLVSRADDPDHRGRRT